MPLPTMGSRPATLVNVMAQSIHGQINLALAFQLDGEEQVSQSTVAREAAPEDLKPGDRVQLDFVFGNVMRVSRI